MGENPSAKIIEEKRVQARSIGLRTHRAEINIVGIPIYQFKVKDFSPGGAGILVKEDSGFLNTIEVGQVSDIDLISPRGNSPSGINRAVIKHITRLEDGRYTGHQLVGMKIKPGD